MRISDNTHFYASSVSRNIHVHCFEPNKKVFDLLNQNIDQNNLSHQIKAHKIALGSEEGEAELCIPESLMSSSLKNNWREPVEIDKVRVSTLDNFCAENNIKESVLIKIDVEGFEEQVLEGGKEFIQTYRPDIIIEILNDFNDSLSKFFKSCGYNFFHVTTDGFKEKEKIIKGQNTGEKYLYMNYLFTTKDESELREIYNYNSFKLKKFPPEETYKLTADCD